MAFIEIDVLGIALDAPADTKKIEAGHLRYGYRQINTDHVVAMDPHHDLVSEGQFRGANAVITLVTGEKFHTPRTIEEIHTLRRGAEKDGLASCFNKKAALLPPGKTSSHFEFAEGYRPLGGSGIQCAEIRSMRLA